jgi:hypothetical protein
VRQTLEQSLAEELWPPPHDPRQRDLIVRLPEWEVRAFPRDGRMHAYFAPRGLLHLQLWHPRARVSVLTPSRLTCGRYEIYPYEGRKLPVADMQALYRAMSALLRRELPPPARLVALERWFVEREARLSKE